MPLKKLILLDLISSVAVVLPILLLGLSLDTLSHFDLFQVHWQIIVALVFLPFFYAIVLGFLIRLLPPLQEGRSELHGGVSAKVWGLYFFLKRPIQWHAFREFFHSGYILRWLYYKALRSDVAFSTTLASGAEIRDPSLFVAGRFVSVGAGTVISGHLILDKTLYLSSVVLGESTNIGGGCTIGPGAKIGRQVLIGYGTFIAPDVKIGEGAVIGSHCRILEAAQIGAGAVIKDDITIAKKSVIGAQEVVKT